MIIAAAGVLVLTGRLDSRKIADGVSISGLSLGGMSRNTAASAIRDAFDPATHDLVLTTNGSTLRLSQAETGAALNTRSILDDAFTIGQEDVVDLSLASYMSMDEEQLYRTLTQAG